MDSKTGPCVYCAVITSVKLNVAEGKRQVGHRGDADTYPT